VAEATADPTAALPDPPPGAGGPRAALENNSGSVGFFLKNRKFVGLDLVDLHFFFPTIRRLKTKVSSFKKNFRYVISH